MDDEICSRISAKRNGLLKFIHTQLEIFHPRDDYRELLMLCSIFLGEKKDNWTFYAPGAHHRAR